jgi:hypothetical protein
MNKEFEGNYSTALMISALSDNARHPERVAHSLSIPAPQSRRYRDDMTVQVIFFPQAKIKGVKEVEMREMDGVPVPPLTTNPRLYDWVGRLKNNPKSKL